jgi:hypothetical protein
MGSLGSNFNYNNLCIAETENKLPDGWKPFHVQKGFRAEESVVSIFRGWSFVNNVVGSSVRSVGEDTCVLLGAMPGVYSAATLIFDPLVARHLKENEGFQTKLDFCRWISKNFKVPAGQFWGTDLVHMLMAPMAEQGVEPYASWKKLPPETLIAPYDKPENINSDPHGTGWLVKIRLSNPAEVNSLMDAKAYEAFIEEKQKEASA